MQHEKIITRDDGSDVKIVVSAYADIYPHYYAKSYKQKEGGDWYRDIGTSYATPEEILTAKLELWEKLKPV